MDALAEKDVAAVVRVIPDPHKDIGLKILLQFHYGPQIKLVTFESLAEALSALMDKEIVVNAVLPRRPAIAATVAAAAADFRCPHIRDGLRWLNKNLAQRRLQTENI